MGMRYLSIRANLFQSSFHKQSKTPAISPSTHRTFTSTRRTAIMSFETTATIASFGGQLLKLKHPAKTTGCDMALNLYLPPQASKGPVPVLIYLSGLTCTGDNCAEKGGF